MCFAMKIVDCTHVLHLAKAQWAGHVQDLYQTWMHPHPFCITYTRGQAEQLNVY